MPEIKHPQVRGRNRRRPSTRKYSRRSRPATLDFTVPKIDLSGLRTPLAKLASQSIIQQPTLPAAPQKSLGDLFWDAIKAEYNRRWRETDPASYWTYQATWALSADWPPELGWLLNLTAIGSAARGLDRISKS